MSTFKVDNEEVKKSIESLKKLLDKCETAYGKSVPVSEHAKGQTHVEMETLCENIKNYCYSMGLLVNNTILFLGGVSEMFDKSDQSSALALFSNASELFHEPKHTGQNHKAPGINAHVANVIKGSLDEDIKTVDDVFDFIDNKYADLPMWLRQHIKSSAKKLFKEGVDAYEITRMLFNGDFEGAIKKGCEFFSDEAGDVISSIVAGKTNLRWDQKLYGQYVVNSVWGGVEAYREYWNDPSLENLGNVFWNSSVGSVLKTTGDAAYNVVSHIPVVGDWYEERGATDMGSMFNVAYSEWVGAIFGEDTGEYVRSYYANNGGLYKGLVKDISTIAKEVKDSCDRNGGLVGVWLSGWNSIFN